MTMFLLRFANQIPDSDACSLYSSGKGDSCSEFYLVLVTAELFQEHFFLNPKVNVIKLPVIHIISFYFMYI